MPFPTLQAAVGPDGSFEPWLVIDSPELAEYAARLVARSPGRWRIV